MIPKKRGRPRKEQPEQPEQPEPLLEQAPTEPVATKRKPAAPRAKPKSAPKPSPPLAVEDQSLSLPDDDDLETTLLEYLVNRRQGQLDRRRQLWSQLAGL